MHKPETERRRGKRTDGYGARGFAEDGDIGRVPAKSTVIVIDPLQSVFGVTNGVIPGAVVFRFSGQFRVCEKAECTKTIIEGNDDRALGSEMLRIILRRIAGAGEKATAMNPEHYRQ